MTQQEEDARFAKIAKDPRFSRVKKNKAKIAVDSRFSSMFTDRSFKVSSKFDKYGRKIQADSDLDSLNSLYHEDYSENEIKQQNFVVNNDEESDLSSQTSDLYSEDDECEKEEIVLEHPQSRSDFTYGERTNRLAITNLDWDYIKAVDLYKLLDSFKPKGGFIKSVKIFPSEFGKKQMEIEDIHGPVLHSSFQSNSKKESRYEDESSKDITEDEELSSDCSDENESDNESDNEGPSENDLSDNEESSDNEDQTDQPTDDLTDNEGDSSLSNSLDEDDVNQLALKKYKLDRLKYYYAIIDCDSTTTASIIYDCCDGAEFEKSSNFLDLRFIPDSVSFNEDEVKDVATEVNEKTFKPKEFSSSSLQNTTQKLVWDEDDVERTKITKKRLSAKELEESCFDALLASGTDSDQDDPSTIGKYKSLLDDKNDSLGIFGKERNEIDDMEVTFTPGLSELATNLLDKKKQELETPFESQLRKGKEKRKEKRKQLKEQFKTQSNTNNKEQTLDTQQLKELVAKEGVNKSDSLPFNPDDERFSAVYKSSLYAIDPIHPSFKKTAGMQKILQKKRARLEE